MNILPTFLMRIIAPDITPVSYPKRNPPIAARDVNKYRKYGVLTLAYSLPPSSLRVVHSLGFSAEADDSTMSGFSAVCKVTSVTRACLLLF